MNAKAFYFPACRFWLLRLLGRGRKAMPEGSKMKRRRHHGVTSFFEMP